jgi:hypothetical protein
MQIIKYSKSFNLLLFIIFLTPFFAPIIGQNFEFMDIPVYKNGQLMSNPWAGGMNAPQWASFDINGDDKNDIYIFDRTGDVHLSFLNMGNNAGEINYKYNRQWLKHFPYVRYFVLMRDYNGDGIVDLFCSSYDEFQKGIKVFTGYWENGFLNFNQVLFPEQEYDIIPFTFADTIIGILPVYLATDYIAIDDLDNDNDLDILTMNQAGNKVNYFKNISIEKGFTNDTLIYELTDDCWGRFGLQPNAQSLSISFDPNICAFFHDPDNADDRDAVHGGTTLCTFDADNDGDKEILYGDLISQHIIFGKNNGNSNSAWMTEQDTFYPVYDTPIDIPFFCATYMLDINNDGAKDLIASPNQIWLTPDREVAWFYENIGSDELPEFNLIKKDFLAESMLDFGTGANPIFVDVNADGLMDIVSGNRFFWTEQGEVSTLSLLINIGTENDPAFEWADSDWLGLSQYSPDLNTITPAFGDMDNDGDEDLILGERWGYLHYAENMAGPGVPMQFGVFQFNWKNINVGQLATPFIYDINKDGLPDLIIGELKGTVNYLPNIGTAENPDFHPIPEESPNNYFFGKINTQPIGSTVGYTQPHILEFGDTMYLATGSFRGWIKLYLINPDSLDSGSFELLEEEWGGLREGSASRIAFTNLNNDEYLDAVVGNDRGGLTIFQSPLTINGLVNNQEIVEENNLPYQIFPNPVKDELNIITSEKINVSIYDMLGREIYFLKNISQNKTIEISKFPCGTYFIKIQKGNSIYTEKIIVGK